MLLFCGRILLFRQRAFEGSTAESGAARFQLEAKANIHQGSPLDPFANRDDPCTSKQTNKPAAAVAKGSHK
jgi:hypothetical protein